MVILTDSEHTVDASAKTITLASPYDALSLAQILKIYNLTTGSVLYDVDKTDGTISISGAVVTYTYDDASMTNGDSMYVEVDSGTTPGGTSSSDPVFTNATRLNTEWAHVANDQPFSAQAADGPSTGIDTTTYRSLGFRLTDAVCDGTLTLTDSDGAPLEFMLDGAKMSSYTMPAVGTNKHTCKIVNGNPDQVIFVLTGRTTGSVTIDTVFQ